MTDFNRIRQFIAVAKCGTLSAAAERLFVSQPALSRSMRQLEQELGVPLFDRQKSKIALNENGKFFLELSEKLTDDFNASIERLRAFDRSRRTITVGSCAPAPLWEILPALSTAFPDKTISSRTKNTESLVGDLADGTATLIVTREPVGLPDCYGFPFGKEHLLLNVPDTHPLAAKKEGVTFREIEGYSFLLYSQIGDWAPIVRKAMPDTHFIVQENWDNFLSLSQISALPSFSSDLAVKYFGNPEGATLIPLLDESAEMTYYCHLLNKNKRELKPFWEKYL